MAALWREASSVRGRARRRLSFHVPGRDAALSYRLASFSSSAQTTPWIRPLGESALLVRFGTTIDVEVNRKAVACMAMLDKSSVPDGVKDVLPTYASLLVKFDPLKVSGPDVEQWCQKAIAASSSHQTSKDSEDAPDLVTIPVRYGGEDGPDIDAAAEKAGLSSAEEVMRLHAGGDYRVYFLGFLGGFPYLGGLPAALAKVPRLDTPRMKLPKGTVGIAGGQTGVYTVSTPGGWYCLGRTSMTLFDPAKDPPALLKAGDFVKFIPTQDEVIEKKVEDKGSNIAPEDPWINIISPGPLTTVQDAGRHGYARHGVSRAGAADALALRMGNALLGNEASAAALEVMMGGLRFRSLGSSSISLTGANCGAKLHRSGKKSTTKLRVNEVVKLQAGDEVDLGYPEDGMRTYVCVKGGVDVPVVLGSRSTDIRTALGGFQGRQLQAGDVLGCVSSAVDGKTQCAAHDPLRASRDTWRLRVLPGPGDPVTDELPRKQLQILLESKFKVSGRADRMAVVITQEGNDEAKAAATKVEENRHIPYGLSEYVLPERIMGEWLHHRALEGGQVMSEGCVGGTIQLPPDGNPVILLAEHQTTGGYKVPCVVIQADLWQVGQMRPGDRIRFVETNREEAVAALQKLHADAEEVRAC